MQVYGIKTCDTVRKALKSLENAGLPATLVDIRLTPLSDDQLSDFIAEFGENLLNKRSTTWRGLTDAERAQPLEILLKKHPTLMKRPVITDGTTLTLGWAKDAQSVWLP